MERSLIRKCQYLQPLGCIAEFVYIKATHLKLRTLVSHVSHLRQAHPFTFLDNCAISSGLELALFFFCAYFGSRCTADPSFRIKATSVWRKQSLSGKYSIKSALVSETVRYCRDCSGCLYDAKQLRALM